MSGADMEDGVEGVLVRYTGFTEGKDEDLWRRLYEEAFQEAFQDRPM
jgi:hypothetical protein